MSETPKCKTSSPLVSDIKKRVHLLSPDNKYSDIDYSVDLKVIESFPETLSEPSQTKTLHVKDNDSEFVKVYATI